MPHLPFFKFFPADWIQDTRILSLDSRGAWIDLLCAMWIAPERGKITWTADQLRQYLGPKADQVVAELIATGMLDSVTCNANVTQCNENVTLISRRMVRESEAYELKKKQTLERVRRYRERKQQGDVTQELRNRSQMSDVRRDNHKNDSLSSEASSDDRLTVKDLVDSWNEEFTGKLPTVEWPLSTSRHRKAAARLKEHEAVQFWNRVFTNIRGSPFLLGMGNANGSWRCTLDFVIANDANCVKIYEGAYSGQKNFVG
jgi:uncharacterized protein YdaU (DUF1376 family)